jgi:hypothetical protein
MTMKNAPGWEPRQRHHLHAMLGRTDTLATGFHFLVFLKGHTMKMCQEFPKQSEETPTSETSFSAS